MPYRHTQAAPLMYLISVLGVVIGLVGYFLDAARWWLVLLGVLLVAVGLVAARLTVVVDDRTVTTTFGWGWPRRRIVRDEIVGIAAVRNSWWHGWGIRKVSGGWMFNNSGRNAVELRLRSGKVFRVGTDQPAEMLAALDERAHTA